jgi:hypothetical protein
MDGWMDGWIWLHELCWCASILLQQHHLLLQLPKAAATGAFIPQTALSSSTTASAAPDHLG